MKFNDSLGIQKLSDSKLAKEDHYLMQRTSPAPVTPSCIISPDLTAPGQAGDLEREGGVKVGGLYHGSFRAIMNTDFLKKEGVTHIVNTAKGLEIFGQKYTVRLTKCHVGLHVYCRDCTDNECAFFRMQ